MADCYHKKKKIQRLMIQTKGLTAVLLRCRSSIYNLLWNIVKEGGHRGLAECQKLFKAEIWNCSLHDQHVFQKLPIFFKRSLPHGK